MKMFRKLLCAALVALIAASALAAFAETRTVYLDSKDFASPVYDYFSIDELAKKDKITAVKSSDKSVLRVVSLQKSNRETTHYEEKATKNSYSAQFCVRLLKAGTASLNYKLNGEDKSQTFNVKKYVNPIKSLVIGGIDETNLKARFARNCYDSIRLAKSAKAGKLTVKAAKGWRIRYAYWEDNGNNTELQCTAGGQGVTACSINLPKMTRKGSYYVGVCLVNVATQGEKLIGLGINN